MATAPHDSLLARLLRSLRGPAKPDPADLGTAFGLDLTFAATEPVAPVAPPPVHRPRWRAKPR